MNKKYTILQNILYLLRKLIFYEGKRYLPLALLRIAVSVFLPLLTVALPGLAVRLYLSDRDIRQSVFLMAGFTLAVFLLKTLLAFLNAKIYGITFLFRIDMGDELLEDILEMEYADFENPKRRDRLQKAERAFYEGNNVGAEAVLNQNMILLTNLLGFTVYSVISASLNPWILALLIIMAVLNGIMNQRNRKWLDNHKDDWTPVDKKIRYMNEQIIDIGNSKDIRIYGMGEWFRKAYGELKAERLGWFKKEYIRYYMQNVLERLTYFIREGALYLYLIYRMTKGMPLDAFLLYLGVAAGFSTWIREIFSSIHELGINSDIVNDYRAFHEGVKGDESSVHMPLLKKHTIELKDVSFYYPESDKPALKDISLVLKPGEKTALVGMNGAGKSTLVKLLCGLYAPTKGVIYMDGVDISTIPKKVYFKEFAVIFQEVFSFAFSIQDNVTCQTEEEVNEERFIDSLKGADLLQRIERLPGKFETSMGKELDTEGILFSGGEMQKLMLARALYKDAPVVILDEPTAALDPLAESSMYEKYNSFVEGKTSVFISHRLSSTRFCDRILLIKDGEIIEEGSHEELMGKQGEYCTMFKVQAHYYMDQEDRKEEKIWAVE
ncbi:ABC transporter ATP-binding protein [Anaerocolumna xylanovorans]|uniref:ATP-binding cassette, subfamily B n=1 Tax=Anaerocolumna xylanovorans DSM 12503 TaxID=1121345 RepID=A0A1M7Y038_9FIRM|nr:ABC transporter ATP-binding protein [Anaerocolumna xylanovorans]SHO44867.1 ATP-binding cassette, subfamily B [Anaerocolumna xylanovorans DSM 12503]